MSGIAHQFDIRFARASGLASFLKAPENSFRWKGSGTLRIDARGVSIAARRGLLAPFAGKQTRRIDAVDLTTVYRECDALRLEFNAPGDQRGIVPFWARDRETAAEIVRLMPTRRTVEIEETLASTPDRFRIDGKLKVAVLAMVVAAAIGVAAVTRFFPAAAPPAVIATAGENPSRVTTRVVNRAWPTVIPANPRPAPEALTLPFPVLLESPRSVPGLLDEIISAASGASVPPAESQFRVVRVPITDGIIPFVPGEPDFERARTQLDLFQRVSNQLTDDYLYGRQSMSEIESRWWALTESLYNSDEFEDRALRPLIDAELAASQNWRGALSMYREAAASGNARDLARARDLVERADSLTARVSLYVYGR